MTGKQFLLKQKKSAWVKLNSAETSVVRVTYSPELLERLKLAIAKKQLPPADRLGLVRDVFALSKSGQQTIAAALDLSRFYAREKDLPVWEELASCLSAVGELCSGQKWLPLFNNFASNLYKPLGKSLGWSRKEGESHADGLLRSLILSQLGHFEDQATLAQAQKLFQNSKKPISPDIRGVVYNVAAKQGNQKVFRKFLQMYRQASHHHEEQDRIGRSLGSFNDAKILKQVLEFSVSKNVRPQDSPSIFIHVARNPKGKELAWGFLKKHWAEIAAKYKEGGHLLEWFVAGFGSFDTAAAARDFESFFKKHPAPLVQRTIAQTVERIYANAAWKKRELKNIENWLKQ